MARRCAQPVDVDDPLLHRLRRVAAAMPDRKGQQAGLDVSSERAVLAAVAELTGVLRLLRGERDRLGIELERLGRREQALAAYLNTSRLGARLPRRRP